MVMFRGRTFTRCSWRTFWVILAFGSGLGAQHYDPYGNRPPYATWNVPAPPPQASQRETFHDVISYQPGIGDVSAPARGFAPPETEGSRKDTPLYGGLINGEIRLERGKSPYLAKEDVVVDRDGHLIVEPGVVVRFAPMVGLTVRGVLTIQGTSAERVTLTSAGRTSPPGEKPLIRLVDGPSVLAGRLQVYHNGGWRSVCSNSKNWTRADMEVACRQLGFQGGDWWSWVDREPGESKPRLLYEEPRCLGTESTIFECRWSARQMGSGICDYHPDLGISCAPHHSSNVDNWRGVRFESARFEKRLKQDNTLYVPVSKSVMQNVDILYAGSGRGYNATSAIDVTGVPPIMIAIGVSYSAYNGINITRPEGPVTLRSSAIKGNRGYGIFVNSSSGDVLVQDTTISDNGGDGIRYIRFDPRLDDQLDRTDIHDFCMFPTTVSQTYPISMIMEQNSYNPTERECFKTFHTKPGQVVTVEVLAAETDRNDSARLWIHDGTSASDRLLWRIPVRNDTKPQSIATTGNSVFVRFDAEPGTQVLALVRLAVGERKKFDVNVTGSSIVENGGRGIAVEGIRSSVHVHQSSISSNRHVAGIHVVRGAGDVNISESRIAFNLGDGVNISYAGGNRNLTRSVLSSNKGYGLSVWLNDSLAGEYEAAEQETVVSYSEIFKNELAGVFVGNFCGDSVVNVTGNWFNESADNAVEILSCWSKTSGRTLLQVGHNSFARNRRLGLRIVPATNIFGKIEYNHITEHTYGGILIKNPVEWEEVFEFDLLPTNLVIQFNEMQHNRGVYVVNLGLSPYSDAQRMLFTRNFVRYNRIKEPFDGGEGFADEGKVRLVPRSRVAAPVVISSANVDVFRNIIQNHESRYEIGSHLEDQSKVINCTFNWLGHSQEEKIYRRLFHRKDRYNLAKIEYLPYLLHSSNPATSTTIVNPMFVPEFWTPGTNVVGGEVDGIETLRAGEYVVEQDINIRPGGKLTLHSGVTLRFPPSVGLMVAGRLEARGAGPNSITLTLKDERLETETEDAETEDRGSVVRLLGGRTEKEGRLQVKVDGKWGTVCDYGWSLTNAALVCHQLGLVLNPDDWSMERSEIPPAGTSESVLLSNVRCTDEDTNILECKAERGSDLENSCGHDNDVGLRCHDPVWAGVRFGVLAEASTLQYVTVEKAGLLDYATSAFKPALQMDLARQSLENVRLVSNSHDGLGIIYADLYSSGASNTVRNSEFSSNRGSGISFKQLGLAVVGSVVDGNKKAGIRHDSSVTKKQQRELAGWFTEKPDPYAYNPAFVPQTSNVDLDTTESRYLITQKVSGPDPIERVFAVRVRPGYVVGIQLLNPIHNRSTEEILVYDSQSMSPYAEVWDLRRDLTAFPTTSSSFAVTIKYRSGRNAVGNCVVLVSSVQAPAQAKPVPTLSVSNTKIRGNARGVWASFYNRYIDENGDHYLRQANESVRIVACDISHNAHEAVYVHSPYWNVHQSNISEIEFVINGSLVTDNGRGIYQFSRDVRQSNNLFHWSLHDNSIERNALGGFEVSLPYVWQYNENFTHVLRLANNTFRGNNQFAFVVDGHFANVTVAENAFVDNKCRTGLVSFRGMEKRMRIVGNAIERNLGSFMIEFRIESQSEILGRVPASFRYNVVKRNSQSNFLSTKGFHQTYRAPSFVVGFHGIQDVGINHNLFGENALDYELIAGIRTAKLETTVDVSHNWWGSSDINVIRDKIFDFDDWNNHAIARFRPYLTEDRINGSLSVSWDTQTLLDLDNLGGRIKTDVTLHERDAPYVVRKDVTIMPEATLYVHPGVVLEFEPNVGILVLGTLKAQGRRGREIVMRPVTIRQHYNRNPSAESLRTESIRLCTGVNCTLPHSPKHANHGFLEYYNRTTMQWVPVCDERFTERNAQVVCKELGFDSVNVRFHLGPRVEFHPNSLTRIWSYPEPLQCTGNEERLDDCDVRLNGQLYNRVHRCEWDSAFVFVHCGERNLPKDMHYWGGVRFANGRFEQNLFENRLHDVVTHENARAGESVFEYVNITGAGILHNEKSPAVQAVGKSPQMNNLNVELCAHDGINLISPNDHIRLLFNSIRNNLGTGISAVSLTGEGRDSEESSFSPLKEASVPYHVFSLVEMCDTTKEIVLEERVLLYFKYDNVPVNCVKIFKSVFGVKPFGFRLLQFNLYNSTGKPGRPDSIRLYDGDIYNASAPLLADVHVGSARLEKKLIRTTSPSLSVRLFANGASGVHGFVAEVVTLPISAIGFNRDVQHNVSYSVIAGNERGGVAYQSAGEVNPTITIEFNQFRDNCKHLYGNFTTCDAAIKMDVQNTLNLYFRNNLVQRNQGGLFIRSDSRGSATALKGWIHNNLWTENWNNPALLVEGRESSAYQEVTIYRNYFTRNVAPYNFIIALRQVISNFTYNYVHENVGAHIMEVSGFEKVRLSYYQSTSHNGFYHNYALDAESRGTIVAGTAGQQYVDNVLFDPDNDYEIMTVNRSRGGIDAVFDRWKSPIDAKHNWWGFNESLAVSGRIKDKLDEDDLLEVDFKPYLMSNESILDGKCPPGWSLVGDTCYIYIGAPMSFHEARDFCKEDNATMPFVMSNYLELYRFLRSQQERYQYYDRVWVQNIDKINQCTVFTYQTIELDACERLSPFVCEIDPKVSVNILNWKGDVIMVAVVGVLAVFVLLLATIVGFWFTKSRKRHEERLERRNSIRQSLHSLKSIGSTNGLGDIAYRRSVGKQKSGTAADYKQMLNGSLDSVEKSQCNSSIDDSQSYDTYETHNLGFSRGWNRGGEPSFDLTYQNKGFRDNSTFVSRENNACTGSNTPQTTESYYDAGTLPLSPSIANTDSIADMKREMPTEYDNASANYRTNEYFAHTPTSERTDNPATTPVSELTDNSFFFNNPPPMQTYYEYNNSVLDVNASRRPSSEMLLETNLDDLTTQAHLLPKSKSEALLETSFDVDAGVGLPPPNEALAMSARSKSQPLETSM